MTDEEFMKEHGFDKEDFDFIKHVCVKSKGKIIFVKDIPNEKIQR